MESPYPYKPTCSFMLYNFFFTLWTLLTEITMISAISALVLCPNGNDNIDCFFPAHSANQHKLGSFPYLSCYCSLIFANIDWNLLIIKHFMVWHLFLIQIKPIPNIKCSENFYFYPLKGIGRFYPTNTPIYTIIIFLQITVSGNPISKENSADHTSFSNIIAYFNV